MTDNGSNWPPGQRDPRLFQPPRPMEPPPPLHHDPRAGDPRSADPQRAGDSPWRRTQRHSRPENAGWQPEASQPAGWQPAAPEGAGWQPATPAPAGQGAGPGPGEYRGGDSEPYRQPDEGDYDTGGRFVPGFGDYAEEDDHAEPPRRGRSARGRSAPPPGPPRRPRRRRFRWIAPLVALAVILIPRRHRRRLRLQLLHEQVPPGRLLRRGHRPRRGPGPLRRHADQPGAGADQARGGGQRPRVRPGR